MVSKECILLVCYLLGNDSDLTEGDRISYLAVNGGKVVEGPAVRKMSKMFQFGIGMS